jgi:hypothetical protein
VYRSSANAFSLGKEARAPHACAPPSRCSSFSVGSTQDSPYWFTPQANYNFDILGRTARGTENKADGDRQGKALNPDFVISEEIQRRFLTPSPVDVSFNHRLTQERLHHAFASLDVRHEPTTSLEISMPIPQP